MQKSTAAKVEELARRADDKQRQINDVTKTVTGGTLSAPKAPVDATLAATLDQLEVQSEFSAITNESEVRHDENVLDFVI